MILRVPGFGEHADQDRLISAWIAVCADNDGPLHGRLEDGHEAIESRGKNLKTVIG